jgi:hypothetical protein
VSRLDQFEPHTVRAELDRVTDVRALELGQHAIDAVHLEPEQVSIQSYV